MLSSLASKTNSPSPPAHSPRLRYLYIPSACCSSLSNEMFEVKLTSFVQLPNSPTHEGHWMKGLWCWWQSPYHEWIQPHVWENNRLSNSWFSLNLNEEMVANRPGWLYPPRNNPSPNSDTFDKVDIYFQSKGFQLTPQIITRTNLWQIKNKREKWKQILANNNSSVIGVSFTLPDNCLSVKNIKLIKIKFWPICKIHR